VEVEKQLTVASYELPPARQAGEILADVDALLDRLENEAKVL